MPAGRPVWVWSRDVKPRVLHAILIDIKKKLVFFRPYPLLLITCDVCFWTLAGLRVGFAQEGRHLPVRVGGGRGLGATHAPFVHHGVHTYYIEVSRGTVPCGRESLLHRGER